MLKFMTNSRYSKLSFRYEMQEGICNGFGYRSLDDLLLTIQESSTDQRDLPQCSSKAGAVPCQFLNFRHVVTADAFYEKINNLYEGHLVKHCNAEWSVHFRALLNRLR
jgi:hypothetical protein